MMAAMKKVLSPSSDTMMTDIAATNAWIKPKLVLSADSSLTMWTGATGEDPFCKSRGGGGGGRNNKKQQKPH